MHMYMYADSLDTSNFKKPGVPNLKIVIWLYKTN